MKRSAGILLFRRSGQVPEFFLVHPGGPYFRNKEAGYWTIPKGAPEADEDELATALREFREETGVALTGSPVALTPIRQKGGKLVSAWALEGDLDPAAIRSNTFTLQWPPRSGRLQTFPEIDKAGWFSYEDARIWINERQVSFLDEVLTWLQQPEA